MPQPLHHLVGTISISADFMLPSKSQKRSHQGSKVDGPRKKTRKTSPEAHRRATRQVSPSKNVHFPRNLIMGPNEADPRRTFPSPVRTALHVAEEVDNSPDAQLEAEQAAALAGITPSKKQKIQHTTKIQKEKWASKASPKDLLDGKLSIPNLRKRSGSSARDHEHVCGQLNYLKGQVREFAESFPPNRKSNALCSLLKSENKHLVRYIGCLAMGGENGAKGWEALLSDNTCRRSLVFGVLGRALKEHVFDELCFGAEAELIEILSKHEQDHAQHDGFFRARQRANLIEKHEKRLITLPALQQAVGTLTAQLEELLLPLWRQGGTTATWKSSHKRRELAAIVAFAAQLSQTMRKDRDTVYYWPPTFKDEEFEPARMECFNLSDMIHESPYDQKTIRGSERVIIRPGNEHQNAAIARVVCFPGLVSYQQGGGQLAEQELAKESRQQGNMPLDVKQHQKLVARYRDLNPLSGNEGFRTKVICKSVVFLQWGRQRLLTPEAGTSAHLTATKSGSKKYEKDYEGFVELYDLFLQETSKFENGVLEDTATSPRQSWLPTVSSLFSRSPSVQPDTG